jgi:oligopeptide transport system ATP-binding protein
LLEIRSIGESASVLIEVKTLKKYFPVRKGVLSGSTAWVRAVDGVSFTVREGETFALVGESGCGKTTTARVILLLEKPTEGQVLFEGRNIWGMKGKDLSRFRSLVQAVLQDPFASLSPRMRVRSIVAEPLVINHRLSRKEVRARVKEILSQVGLSPHMADLFPHEFSGGQRQRIAISRALIVKPRLIILDEPVSALDVSIQAQIMNLLKDLQTKLGLSYLLITHNLATVRYMSHEIGVMYLGRLVERGPGEEIFRRRLHPYTKALFSAALPSHPNLANKEIVLKGEVPSPLNPPKGCRFHPRCSQMKPVCRDTEPKLKEVTPGYWVACHLFE